MAETTPTAAEETPLADTAGDGARALPPTSGQDTSPEADPKQTGPEPAKKETAFVFDPLAPYKGAFRRFFTVYRHVLGLLFGGLVAYLRSLPPSLKRGFRHFGARVTARIVRPFLKRELVELPFPQQLRRRLEILGPTFIKLGQIMAIREDLLPKEITSELENLLDKLPQVPFEQVRRTIEQDLERPLEELFSYVDPHPLGSASIAQAHFARTLQGDKVVLKVIKPGIRDVLISDLKLLEWVGVLLQWLLPRYQPQQIITEFSNYTLKEVDYSFEADNAEIFAANFADMPDVIFPEIYHDLSGEDVITMEFIDGLRPGAAAAQQLTESERDRVVDLGAASIIRMLYKDGFFHADLHAGNLKIIPGDPVRIGFIDLGMVGRFGDDIKRRMLYYFHALVEGEIENATRYLVEMAEFGEGGDPQGFRRAVSDLSRRFLMHGTGGQQLSIAQLILESLSLGGKYRLFFPVEMTLMVKALVTFEGVGRTMKPDLSIPDVSQRHLSRIFRDRFDPRQLGRQLFQQAPEMVDLMVKLPQLLSAGFNAADSYLQDRTPENPLGGLRSAIMGAACVMSGVLVILLEGPLLLWIALFLIGATLFLFGD